MCRVRAERVRGVVVVGEVVDEQVEAVPRHEPAPDRGGVVVDRAGGTVAPRRRGSGLVGLEQAVEEEAARPEHRPGNRRHARQVLRAAAVAGDVHRGRDEARVLGGLEDGDGVAAEMRRVHVHDRVADRLPGAGRPHRPERRAVLDQPLLAAVVPDEVRDLVHVRIRARGDRREAHGRQRGEDGRRRAGSCRARPAASARASTRVPSEPSSIDGVRPSTIARTTFRLTWRASAGPRSARPCAGAAGRRGRARRLPRDSRRPARRRARRVTSAAPPTSTASPPRVPPRRSAPTTTCEARKACRLRRRALRRGPPSSRRSGTRRRLRRRQRAPRPRVPRHGERPLHPAASTPIPTPRPSASPIVYQSPILAASVEPPCRSPSVWTCRLQGIQRPRLLSPTPHRFRGGESDPRRAPDARVLLLAAIRSRPADGEPAGSPRPQGAKPRADPPRRRRRESGPRRAVRDHDDPDARARRGKQALGRIEGRASAPRIERLLAEHLEPELAAA